MYELLCGELVTEIVFVTGAEPALDVVAAFVHDSAGAAPTLEWPALTWRELESILVYQFNTCTCLALERMRS